MRLIAKLTLILMLGAAVVLTIQAVFHVSRLLALHERETRDDLSLLGSSLGAAVSEIWRVAGEPHARAYVRRADTRRSRTRIQLFAPSPALAARLGALPGGTVLVEWRDDKLVARVPVAGSGQLACLQLTRDLAERTGFIRHVIWTQVVTTAAMVVIFAAIAMILGVKLVGRRVERLAEQARRVARGVYVATEDQRSDELGFLAREMNQMAARLQQAQGQIREERRARTQLLEQLRHSDRLSTIGRIASSIAHELGTPLNVVSGRAMMIAEDEETADEVREGARIIAQQARQMTRHIRQLLDYARGAGPQRTQCEVGELVDQALKLMEPLADSQNVTLHRVEAAPIGAELDSGKVLQVMTNLVMNGIQSMPEGGTLTVEAECADVERPEDIHAAAGRYVSIKVSDEGVGIAPDALEQIFEPFFTTKSSGQGTGLGLSVCHGIVREHGGWLSVQSRPGEGSCFSVFLPCGGEP